MNNETQFKDCFISTSGIEKIDIGLNTLKTSILKTYTKINVYTFEERPGLDVANNTFFKCLAQLLPIIMTTIIKFCMSSDME